LFADTPASAHVSVVIYSLIETARADDLAPCTWLRRMTRELPATQSIEVINALLSRNLHCQDFSQRNDT
jgi:transposase